MLFRSAISRFGSSSDFIARYALQKIGLTPGKDVTIVQIGSTTARVDAALSGRVQATVVNPPASIIAQKRGMRRYLDRLRDESLPGYLETDKLENVKFYEKFGFVVTHQEEVIGAPTWYMWRRKE